MAIRGSLVVGWLADRMARLPRRLSRCDQSVFERLMATIPRIHPIAIGSAVWLNWRIHRFSFGGRKSRDIRVAHDARFDRTSSSRFGRPWPRKRAAQVRAGVEVLAVERVQPMPVGMAV